MLRFSAVLALSILLTHPVLAAFGPERPVVSGELLSVPDSRRETRIASNGTGYLVVWNDQRFGAYGIYGARVAADGTVLDETGFFIAAANAPEVVWSGTTYVVFWPAVGTGGLMSATVSPEGVVGTPRLSVQTPQMLWVGDYAVASNGSTMLAVTALGVGALLELDGEPIGQMPLGGDVNLLNASVAIGAIGNEYLVAFGAASAVITQRVSFSGQPSAPVKSAQLPTGCSVALASDGTDYLLVCASKSVIAQVYSKENVPIGGVTSLAPAATIAGIEIQSNGASAVWRGSDYLVTFGQKQETELYGVRVARDGNRIGPPFKLGDSLGWDEARVAKRSGSDAAAVWVDRDGNVQFARLGDSSASSPRAINASAPPQLEPSLVRAGNQMIAAWLERRPEGFEVRVAPLGGEARVVASAGAFWAPEVRVVWDGDAVWVVWVDETVWVRRFTAQLQPIDPAPVRIEQHEEAGSDAGFAVAAGRSGILIVLGSYADLFATAVHVEGGNLLQTTTRMVTQDYPFHHPAAVWDGNRYVLAFAHDLGTTWWQFPQPFPNEVLVTRLSREGSQLDATPIIASAEPTNNIDVVRVARGADGAIGIAWQNAADEVFVTRFTGTANPPSRKLASASRLELGPLVALTDGYALFRHTLTDVRYEGFTRTLQPRGEVQTLPPFRRAYFWDPFYDVTTFADRLYVAYIRATPDSEYGGVPRLFWRSTDETAPRRRAVR